jgi:hypothetical protein
MRIAVSGAQCVGKSTLIEELSRALPRYRTVEEPYAQLVDEGHDFAEEPSIEDFELQLERSIESLEETEEEEVLFERCPADLLAYLVEHPDAEAFDLDDWLPRVREAMERLDLVVFVPIERRDRIAAARGQDLAWRARVDRRLRRILADDPWELSIALLEVSGSPYERAEQVLGYLRNPSE